MDLKLNPFMAAIQQSFDECRNVALWLIKFVSDTGTRTHSIADSSVSAWHPHTHTNPLTHDQIVFYLWPICFMRTFNGCCITSRIIFIITIIIIIPISIYVCKFIRYLFSVFPPNIFNILYFSLSYSLSLAHFVSLRGKSERHQQQNKYSNLFKAVWLACARTPSSSYTRRTLQ